ncbi:hypothetical protein BLNAU_19165 [Blattamonas nauphoetae]|uniref:Mariner Mos1 transposase n=1 Tax=Blattamonas nauphoetae TaxID=2049346 RepID=A0ABQ9X270_9EUKA|nr:hypothetical protein BLNAU_19165 [Blattamonas nauphoetae]
MYYLFFGVDHVPVVEPQTANTRMTATYFRDRILVPMDWYLFAHPETLPSLIHYDNAAQDKAASITEDLEESGLSIIPHPPYSPDISPCDFAIFFSQKRTSFRGKRTQTVSKHSNL